MKIIHLYSGMKLHLFIMAFAYIYIVYFRIMSRIKSSGGKLLAAVETCLRLQTAYL